MSPAPAPLRAIIGAARAAVRRDALAATIIALLAVIPALLLVAWLLSLTTNIAHKLPLTLDLIALAVAGGFALWAVRRWVNRVTDRAVAASAENALGFSEGELQSVLEMSDAAPAGTSAALLRRAESQLAERLSGTAPHALAGTLGTESRRRRTRALAAAGVLSTAVIVLAFTTPERSRASWSPLLRPVATIAATALPPLEIAPGNISVARGEDLVVHIGAAQREAVTLYWREKGDVLNEQTLPVLSDGAVTQIKNVDAQTRYWARSPDGAVTDTFTITPVDPLLVSALTIDVVYPGYLRRAPEHFEKDVPPLELPAGTELRINGRSTRAVTRVSVDLEQDSFPLEVSGNTFRGSFVPRASGSYTWTLSGESANEAAATPAPLEIKVITDAAPEIELTYPGVDTLLPGDMKQLLVADARDDHAVIAATVVSWRTSATGQKDAPVEQSLSLEGEADRRLVRGVLDLTARRLLPGDTLSYFVRVVDNSPMRQTALSRTFTLRMPGMEELRERAQDEAEDLVKDANEVARAMQQLQARTRELQRKSQTGSARAGERGSGGAPGQQQMSGEQAEQARQVLQRQEALAQEMDKLRDRLESLTEASKQAGLQDPEMQQRLEELSKLYDQLLTPEMKKQMEELRAALEKLDPEQVQKALEELAKKQDELRARLDQSLELMRRAAAEQEMSKLSQEAKELATQQDALAEQMKNDEQPKETAEKQKELGRKADKLSDLLSKLKRKLSEQGENEAAGKTGEAQKETDDAKDEMSQAAQKAGQKQGDDAARSGDKAAEKLNDAAETLDAARKQMADAWKKETQESVDNATQDAINLAEMQKELLDKMQASKQLGGSKDRPEQQQGGQQQKPGAGMQQGQQEGKQQAGNKPDGQQQGGQAGNKGQGQQKAGQEGQSGSAGQPGSSQGSMQQMRSDQAAVKQGLEQLGRNLQEAGQRSAMVNKDVGAALARANLSTEQTMRALEQASEGEMPAQQAEETLDALNRLALELLKNSQQIEQSESGTGVQEALKQLAELAKQQGSLNGKSNSLMPMNLGARAMSQQMGALAREQRDIAQKLGGMNKGGSRDDLLGRLDELVREADNVARELEGGRLTPQTVQRQNELFHKLLDAGKTMERDEVSEERKAEAAQPLPPAVLRALKPGLFNDQDRYAAPTPEQLRELPPAYRRLILEYFQKLNSGSKQENRAQK